MNRHTKIAIVIAPFLAIGGYILADFYHAYESKPTDKVLIATGDCKPLQNQCEIQGIGLKFTVQFNAEPAPYTQLPITLVSATDLNDVVISLLTSGVEAPPTKMSQLNDAKNWQTELLLDNILDFDDVSMRIAVSYKGELHLAEIPIKL